MAVTGHKNEGSIKSYATQPCSNERAVMCNILHTFGKVGTQTTVKAIEGAPAATSSALVVSKTQENTAINSSSAVFSGANFNGATTINVQINQK